MFDENTYRLIIYDVVNALETKKYRKESLKFSKIGYFTSLALGACALIISLFAFFK